MPVKHRENIVTGSYDVFYEFYAVAIHCRCITSGALYEMNRVTWSTKRICGRSKYSH